MNQQNIKNKREDKAMDDFGNYMNAQAEKRAAYERYNYGRGRMQFRKKPIINEAVQWTGDNLREIIDFTGLHPSAQKWTWEEYEEVVKREGLKIFTLEGPLFASVGDYIMRGVNGEFYPIKPDILAKTYDRVG